MVALKLSRIWCLPIILSFQAVFLLPRVKSQGYHELPQKLQVVRSHQDALRENPNLVKELHKAQDALQHLWIKYLPELWEINLSSGCVESLDYLFPGLRDNSSSAFPVSTKLLPLIDATGKQGAGLLSGNLFLDGAYDECFNYNYTGYCLANQVNLTIYPLSWQVGLCVPKFCTNTDIAVLINKTGILVTNETKIKCEDSKKQSYSAGAIAMIVVTLVLASMVVVGTLVDVLLQSILYFEGNGSDDAININSCVGSSANEKTPLLVQQEVKNDKHSVRMYEFLTAFSLFKTVPTLFATKQTPSVITSLNGMRVISMFWVILGHTYIWFAIPGTVDNQLMILPILSRFSFQAVGNAFYSVDSFFFLSGVLVAYLTLREMKKKNGQFPFLMFYIHRYLRLTPTYAFVLFFSWLLYYHFVYSPSISFGVSVFSNCPKYWWTNLLYINNLYPWKMAEECMGWAWYLGNDMQFYIISPFILIPFYYSFPFAMVIVAALLLGSFIVTATLAGIYDFQSNVFAIVAYNYTGHTDPSLFSDLVYIKPWSRIQPYLVGMVLGYILYKGIRLPFGRKKNVPAYLLLWVVSGLISFAVVYGLYSTWHGHTPAQFENVMYITFSRFVWGVGMALVVFCCHNGYGWFINSFLSMKIWTPLSRMTFNAYLVHPVVLTMVYGQFQKSFHYTDKTIAFFLIGFVVLSYAIAGLLCLLVELPLGTIEMLVFKLVGMTARESQRQTGSTKHNKM